TGSGHPPHAAGATAGTISCPGSRQDRGRPAGSGRIGPMSAPSGIGVEVETTRSEPGAGRAGVPPLLLGAALLFWGWQTGWIWLGIAAALVLESPRVIGRRWRFAQIDLDRIWNLCVLLFFGSFVVAFTTSDGVGVLTGLLEDRSMAARSETLVKGARSLMLVFEWLPLTLLPMALAQQFADQTRMEWSTFSHWLRRQRRLARPRPAESGLNFGWPYFAACLLA